MPRGAEQSGAFVGGSGDGPAPPGRARAPLPLAPGFKPVMLASLGWIALTTSAAFVAEHYWPSPQTAAASTAPRALDPNPVETATVRFTNPFDEGEVFEFPAGTSHTEARELVAHVLMERARDRLGSMEEPALLHSALNTR